METISKLFTSLQSRIKQFIKDKGFVTKKNILDYLGWGVRIKFSPYRNALRKYKEIKFTKYGYEWIGA